MLIILLLMVIAAICVITLRPTGEPKYKGHKLSEWLQTYQDAVRDRNFGDEAAAAQIEESERAVRAIGTNALPWALQWMAGPPPWKEKLFNKLPGWLTRREFVARLVIGSPNSLAEGGFHVFGILGTNAAGAVPQLGVLINNTQSPHPILTLHALSAIGTPAIPVLTNLANSQPQWRSMIVITLGQMALRAGLSETNLYTPIFIQYCHDPDLSVRMHATNALEQMFPQPLPDLRIE